MHKYPFLYNKCENTIGYDDMIERLGKNQILLTMLDNNCMSDDITSFRKFTDIYDELIDFLDGNGFFIIHCNDNIIHIVPIERKYIIK